MTEPFDLPRSRAGVEAVLNICRRPGRILALMQNNPDPDAIACAGALRDLVQDKLRKRVVIAYGGVCGRAENAAMMRVLRIEARHISPDDLDDYRTLCLVDTQPLAGNNALFASRTPEIVIDHHIVSKRKTWQAEFHDVRPDYGATSTILYEYLLAAGHKISVDLATALFYGIRSDTQELGRETSPADVAAHVALGQVADRKKLGRIRRAPVSAEYFRLLHESLANCVVAGTYVITAIHSTTNPDMMSEVADMMLRLEGMRVSVCYGAVGNVIHISARSVDARSNVADHVRRVVRRLGTGGGHRTMAGGQIPVEGNAEKRMALVHERILSVFAPGKEPYPLLVAQNRN